MALISNKGVLNALQIVSVSCMALLSAGIRVAQLGQCIGEVRCCHALIRQGKHCLS